MTEQEAIDVFKGFKFLPREQRGVDMAIKALEKQIPNKPQWTHHCPNCGHGLPCKGITDEYCSECFNWKYCPYCGQALEWE